MGFKFSDYYNAENICLSEETIRELLWIILKKERKLRMSKQELVDKNEVLSIWHNYWESDKLAYEAEDELRELKTIICITELNENQQIVLDWLKESCKLHGLREVIEIMGFLSTTGGKMKYKQVAYAYGDLNDDELKQVLQAFSQWSLEQEEK